MSCLEVSSCFTCGLDTICISIIGFENRRNPRALKRAALAAVEDPQPGTQRSELRQAGWRPGGRSVSATRPNGGSRG